MLIVPATPAVGSNVLAPGETLKLPGVTPGTPLLSPGLAVRLVGPSPPAIAGSRSPISNPYFGGGAAACSHGESQPSPCVSLPDQFLTTIQYVVPEGGQTRTCAIDPGSARQRVLSPLHSSTRLVQIEELLLRVPLEALHVRGVTKQFGAWSSFDQCIAWSARFSAPATIAVAAAAGSARIASGFGVDRARVAAHVAEVESVGLLSFLERASASCKAVTLQPRPQLLLNPPARCDPLPVAPHPFLSASIPHTHQPRLDVHLAALSINKQSEVAPPYSVPAFARAQTAPLHANMSLDAKLHWLAVLGGPLMVAENFKPNMGIDVVPYPPSMAPPSAMEAHFALNHSLNRMVILPLHFMKSAAEAASLRFHVSRSFLVGKEGSLFNLQRLVTNYSSPEGASLMFDGKKMANATSFHRIRNPSAADLCQALLNASLAFPGERIFACRMDVESAYNRIRVRPRDIPLGALLFTDVHADKFVAMPLVEWFGSQDSNYHFHCLTEDLASRSAARCMAAVGTLVSAMYTDDFAAFGSLTFLRSEMSAFSADAEAAVGGPGVKASKTLFGAAIEIIGYHIDCDALTIGVSESMYGKLVCIFFHTLSLSVEVGDPVALEVLQRLASLAMRAADVMPAMLPYSRGFSANTAGLDGRRSVALTLRSVADIQMWRIALRTSFGDNRWLRVPIHSVLLHRKRPGECEVTRAYRQAASADVECFGDACTDNGSGIGVYVPDIGCIQLTLPGLLTVRSFDAIDRPININVLEFIAAILAMLVSLRHILTHTNIAQHSPYPHVHVWTDNSACRIWMLKHRADHPLHAFLLQVMSHLSLRYGVLVTVGPLPGSLNVFADALSRGFKCPNGPSLQRQLQLLPEIHPPLCFMRAIEVIASQPCLSTSSVALAALTALDGVIGWLTA